MGAKIVKDDAAKPNGLNFSSFADLEFFEMQGNLYLKIPQGRGRENAIRFHDNGPAWMSQFSDDASNYNRVDVEIRWKRQVPQ